MGKNIPIEAFTEPTMKIFLLFVTCLLAKETLGQAKSNAQAKISIDQRAPSTFENCNCQCNSDTWTDGQYIRGNCRSKDRNGALFCYVSGSALCSCRDVQVSSFLKNNQGRFKLYSYEACTTPPRNQCNNQGYNSNLGDGDFPFCSYNNNNNFGNNNFGNNNFGNNNNYRPSGGISSSSGYRPGSSSSSGYRPGGSTSSGYRPGGSTSFGGSSSSGYRPGTGNGYNPPRNKPSLGDILSGVRTGSGSSGSSSSSGSSDSASSSGAISFDA